MKHLRFTLIVILGTSLRCFGETSIRVLNDSDFDFKNVQIDNKYYGNIAAHQYSGYQSFEIAYRYNYVKLFIKGQEFEIQPIDYVGEKPLGKGNFTYLLRVVDFEKRDLDISYREDKEGK